jgi:hypothetical protein
MLNAVGDSLGNVASSDEEEDGEDDEDTDHGKQRDDNEPGWVMGIISKTVQHHMVRSRQKQMKLEEWTQLR